MQLILMHCRLLSITVTRRNGKRRCYNEQAIIMQQKKIQHRCSGIYWRKQEVGWLDMPPEQNGVAAETFDDNGGTRDVCLTISNCGALVDG